jgi:predicted TIM-barrel enzyme
VPPGAQVKALRSGSLTRAQVVYGLTHQTQEAKQLATLKTVDFNRLRVYRLPTSLKTMFHVSDAESEALVVAMLGEGVQVAQTTPAVPGTNGSPAPMQHLRDVLANITVTSALKNSNVNVALPNVLSGNKIAIAQVVGVYAGGGIITAITK